MDQTVSLQKEMDQNHDLMMEQADQLFELSRKDIPIYDDNLIDVANIDDQLSIIDFDHL